MAESTEAMKVKPGERARRAAQRRILARAVAVVVAYRARWSEWPKCDYVAVAATCSHGTAHAAIMVCRAEVPPGDLGR